MSATIVDNVTYVGDISFADAHEPVPSKSEWGMDQINRTMRGGQPNLVAFMEGLGQGASYTFNGNIYYLQTWECDNHPVFPSVSMMYKGLTGGIPPPKASGSTVEQSLTLTSSMVSGYKSAQRDIRFLTRQSSTLYIATSAPLTATYGLDVNFNPYAHFISSVIRATDTSGNDYVYSGADAPAALVTALTPVGYLDIAVPQCTPVVGSPYFECTDTCTRLLPGGN